MLFKTHLVVVVSPRLSSSSPAIIDPNIPSYLHVAAWWHLVWEVFSWQNLPDHLGTEGTEEAAGSRQELWLWVGWGLSLGAVIWKPSAGGGGSLSSDLTRATHTGQPCRDLSLDAC